MKFKNYLPLLLLFGTFLFIACEEEGINPRFVPQELKNDLNDRHPDASKIEWEREGDLWEVEFEENGLEVGILYDLEFNWIRTEMEIAIDDLPGAVKEYISANYPGGVIEEAASFESSNEGNGFIAEVIFGKMEHETFYDLDGNFIREEVEADDGD